MNALAFPIFFHIFFLCHFLAVRLIRIYKSQQKNEIRFGKKVSLCFCSLLSNIQFWPSLLKWKWILMDLFSIETINKQEKKNGENKAFNNFIKIHKQFSWLLWSFDWAQLIISKNVRAIKVNSLCMMIESYVWRFIWWKSNIRPNSSQFEMFFNEMRSRFDVIFWWVFKIFCNGSSLV